MQLKQIDGSVIEVPIHGLDLDSHFRLTEIMSKVKEADTATKKDLIKEAAVICIPNYDPQTCRITFHSLMAAIAETANAGKVTTEERKKSD